MIFVTIVSCVRWVCVCLIPSILAPVGVRLTYQPGFEKKKTNTMLGRVLIFETEPMTVAPYHTTMKNFHSPYRPLSQPLSSLYRQPPESNLLYAPRLKHGRLPQSTYSIERRHGRDEHVVDSLGPAKTNKGEAGARLSFAEINNCLVQCLPLRLVHRYSPPKLQRKLRLSHGVALPVFGELVTRFLYAPCSVCFFVLTFCKRNIPHFLFFFPLS